MKSLLVLATLMFGQFTLATPELPTKKITVDIKKAGVRNALQALFDNSGSKYVIFDEVTNDTKIDIEAKKTKWSEVFNKVLTQAGLTYHFAADGTIEVMAKTAAEPAFVEPDPAKSTQDE